MYANGNKGYLPYAIFPSWTRPAWHPAPLPEVHWYEALSPYMPGGEYHHAVYGADVVLGPLNLCAETLDGVRHAIAASRATGVELKGVRLDSGDLAYLSIQASRMLDDAGFPDASIVLSNDLDEILVRPGQGELATDDAIDVERTTEGWRLGVHIADVAHYVHEGGALDSEAFARGTSVYFPERAVHMFPEALATGLCSLRPQVDRLVQSCLMEIDRRGAVVVAQAHRATGDGDDVEGGSAGVVEVQRAHRHQARRALHRRDRHRTVPAHRRQSGRRCR